MGFKTQKSFNPAADYGKGFPGTARMMIDGVIAAANDLDRWYTPPSFRAPSHGNNKGVVRIADIQGFYGLAPVGAATGADTYTVSRVTAGGVVLLLATITMTSLKASVPISIVSGFQGAALLAGEYLRLDCTAIATYATTQPLYFRCQFSFDSFGIVG